MVIALRGRQIVQEISRPRVPETGVRRCFRCPRKESGRVAHPVTLLAEGYRNVPT